jgi:lipopolysaccharide transport system permease protein
MYCGSDERQSKNMAKIYTDSNYKQKNSLVKLVHSIYVNRSLIATLTKKEITARYKGSILGIFWTLLTPILMLAIYTIVFSEIFKVRWSPIDSTASESKLQFALIVLTGMIIFNFFSEIISRSTTLIRLHTNYVKKVIFPLEILPIVLLCDAGFHALISFIILFAGVIYTGTIHADKILLLPLLVFPFAILCLGISYVISSLSVYFRDMVQASTLLITALMFLSPIFYPLSAVPEQFRYLITANPITYVIEEFRGSLFFNYTFDVYDLIAYNLISILVLLIGFTFFQITRRGFSDVL